MTARILDLRVGRRGRPRERSVITRVLVVDPPLLRVWRMMTGLVPSTRLTLTGMTLSGQSWPSSETSTPWKSLQVSHQLDLWVDVRDFSGIPPACLSLGVVASRRH